VINRDDSAAGLTVEAADEVSQPFFSPTGQVITVNGEGDLFAGQSGK
jgi:hypothetical protein